MRSQPKQASSGRVTVSLKALIDLAISAHRLNLHHRRNRAAQSGGFVSRFKGRGMEFDEARSYQPGDDIRTIDWRVTARTGTTHTKVFREERERPVFVSVDNRQPMHFATRGVFKSVLASQLAALLAWAAEYHGDRIGGQLFTEYHCLELKPQNGRHAVLRLLNALANPDPMPTQSLNLEQIFARLNHHARPGSLVYIISDFRGLNDAAESYIAKLALHCEVVLIFVYDPLEKDLPKDGRYRFADDQRDITLDTGDRYTLNAYQGRFALRLQRLEALAKKRGLTLLQCCTTETPLNCLR